MIYACTPDLADRSKVATLGGVTFVRSGADLATRAGAGDVVIVDLARTSDLDIDALTAAGARVIAFTNHADDDAMAAAKAAGADAVARSVFFRRLTEGTLLGDA